TLTVFAQKKKSIDDVKYRRNSLATILLSDGNYENKDKVLNAYASYKFPEQYDDHRIDVKSADLTSFILTEEEMESFLSDLGKTKEEYETSIEVSKAIFGEGFKDERMDIYKIKKFLKDSLVANKLLQKWFDNDSNNKIDQDLITKRGLYNLSKEEIDVIKNSAGTAKGQVIRGASLDLIPQTFVVLNKMNFISNELMASLIKTQTDELAPKEEGMLRDMALAASQKIYEKTSIGYSVWTTSYLFKLKYEKKDQDLMYYDMDQDGFDFTKQVLSYDLELEHIGTEKANSLVTVSLKKEDKDRSEDDIINLATIRNVEKVFSKLTKKYEDFKPKVPLADFGKPITAFIGMKEGLKGGETFEILNEEFDNKTGRVIYRSVGKIKVDKKSVWDNRQTLDGEPSDPSGPDRTSFKGKAKKATYGSLLRLIK
ncbi:MAG: hypothetical protein ACKVJR_08265, partial [Flavobacteriales bacterium]